jgi:hypothetical protein
MEAFSELRCPQCHKVILRSTAGDTIYLARVTRFESGRTLAACPRCKHESTVPLKLVEGEGIRT